MKIPPGVRRLGARSAGVQPGADADRLRPPSAPWSQLTSPSGCRNRSSCSAPTSRSGAITAFLLTEPDVGSDPARLAATATPVDDGTALRTRRAQAVDDERGDCRAGRGHGSGAGARRWPRRDHRVYRRVGFAGNHHRAPQRLHGSARHRERPDQVRKVRVPAANRLAREADGLKVALTTPNTGRLSIPALCTVASKWCIKIARE
jgi:hypothetical protein